MRPVRILRALAHPDRAIRLAFSPGQLSFKGVNTSKNRKVASLILGLAVTALVVDKVFLGGGATPTLAADAAAQPAALAPGGPSAVAAASSKGTATWSVATKLERMSDRLDLDADAELGDAFAPPRAFAEVVEAEQKRARLVERKAKAEETAKRLLEQLKVTATMTNGKASAKINGTFYELGSEVTGTGFRLTEVRRNGVTLEDAATNSKVELKLNPDL